MNEFNFSVLSASTAGDAVMTVQVIQKQLPSEESDQLLTTHLPELQMGNSVNVYSFAKPEEHQWHQEHATSQESIHCSP